MELESNFYLPYNQKLIARAKELRKNMTIAEKKLWYEYLKTHPLKFMKQRPIDNFIVDFYCPKVKLIIEIDGDTHFNENALIYDEERTAILENYGLKVIRFTNEEVISNFEGVCQKIEQFLIILNKLPPLLRHPC